MLEIRCPHCGHVFEEDESKFQNILSQVYQHQLEEALEQRDRSAEAVRRSSVAAAQAQAREKSRAELAARDQQIAELTAQLAAADETTKAQIDSAVLKEQSANAAQIAKLEARVAELEGDAARFAQSAELERQLAVTTAEAKLREEAVAAEAKLREEAAKRERELQEAATARENELRKEADARENELREAATARENELSAELESRDEELARMRDMRSRMSTKMLGESLEQHCEIAFNQLRATAFKTAEFGKDTQAVSSGEGDRATKGDYIFRDFDENGDEFVSIMFEMKTDDDRTDTHRRRKNEDFFAKLDRDRAKKGCEYAVLVSLLEPDSELYNQGIVDVSWAYDKMYVIRPQLFVPMITLLRDAAKTQLSARKELAEVRRQNIDVTNFESEMEKFKNGFTKNYESASTHFAKVIDEIDKTIKELERMRSELQTTARQLRLANDKVEGLTIRRLTSKSPSVREKFEEARREAEPLVEPAPEGEEATEPDSVE